jgi:hypothetical protein
MGNELYDGVYLSEKQPLLVPENQFNENALSSTDYFCRPYQSFYIIVWKNEKPKSLSWDGEGSHGSALVFQTTKPGYIAVCMEND